MTPVNSFPATIFITSAQVQNDTAGVLENPTVSTNWWGIILLIGLALFAAWLKKKLR